MHRGRYKWPSPDSSISNIVDRIPKAPTCTTAISFLSDFEPTQYDKYGHRQGLRDILKSYKIKPWKFLDMLGELDDFVDFQIFRQEPRK